jgi:hypothetical protein
MIGSAQPMLLPPPEFGKRENAARHCLAENQPHKQRGSIAAGADRTHQRLLAARTQFKRGETCRNVEADLTLHAERLQCERIGGAADQNVAAKADADRGAALRACVVAGEIARSEPRHRRVDAPG